MPINAHKAYTVKCDYCGLNFDTIDEFFTVLELMETLKNEGWKGNARKLKCLKCVKESKGE